MAFEVDKKKEKYYADQDISYIRKKYKGKLPPFGVLSRAGQEIAFKEHTQLRTKGTLVSFKGQTAIVTSSNKKGVYLKNLDKDFLDSKNEKPYFVKYENYLPFVMFHPFNRVRAFESMVV